MTTQKRRVATRDICPRCAWGEERNAMTRHHFGNVNLGMWFIDSHVCPPFSHVWHALSVHEQRATWKRLHDTGQGRDRSRASTSSWRKWASLAVVLRTVFAVSPSLPCYSHVCPSFSHVITVLLPCSYAIRSVVPMDQSSSETEPDATGWVKKTGPCVHHMNQLRHSSLSFSPGVRPPAFQG
jgi:hypothetical protein